MQNTSANAKKISKAQVYSLKNNEFVRNGQLFGKESKFSKIDGEVEPDDKIAAKIFKNNLSISHKLLSSKVSKTNLVPLPSISTDLFHTHHQPQLQRALSPTASLNTDPHTPLLNYQGNQTARANYRNFNTAASQTGHEFFKEKLQNKFAKLSADNTPQPKHTRAKSEAAELVVVDPTKIEKEAIGRIRFEMDRHSTHSSQNLKRDVSYLSESKKGAAKLEMSSAVARNIQFSSIFSRNLSPSSSKSARRIDEGNLESNQVKKSENISENEQIDSHQPSPRSFSKMAQMGFYNRQSNRSLPSLFNNEIHTPLISSPVLFSRTFYPDNRIEKPNGDLGVQNLQASEYRERFRELTHFPGETAGSEQTISTIPRITSNETKSAHVVKTEVEGYTLKWEDILDDAELQSLKKELPNIFSGALPNRTDVVLLSKWVQEKINTIASLKDCDEREKCKKCDSIYNIALNEIIRQISIDCFERGNLLYRIWMSYLRIFQGFRKQLVQKQEQFHDQFEDTYNKLHKMYKDTIAEKDAKIIQNETQMATLRHEFEEVKGKYDKMHGKEVELKQTNVDLKKIIVKLKSQVKTLQKENDTLSYRLEGRHVVSGRSSSAQVDMRNSLSRSGSLLASPVLAAHHPQTLESSAKKLDYDRKPSIISNLGQINEIVKAKNIGDDSDVVTEESSENFEIENQESETEEKEVYKIDQLNNAFVGNLNLQGDKELDHRETSTQDPVFYAMIGREIACQTELNLVDKKYDNVMDKQSHVDELVTEHQLRLEVDVVAVSKEFKLANGEKEEPKEPNSNPSEAKKETIKPSGMKIKTSSPPGEKETEAGRVQKNDSKPAPDSKVTPGSELTPDYKPKITNNPASSRPDANKLPKLKANGFQEVGGFTQAIEESQTTRRTDEKREEKRYLSTRNLEQVTQLIAEKKIGTRNSIEEKSEFDPVSPIPTTKEQENDNASRLTFESDANAVNRENIAEFHRANSEPLSEYKREMMKKATLNTIETRRNSLVLIKINPSDPELVSQNPESSRQDPDSQDTKQQESPLEVKKIDLNEIDPDEIYDDGERPDDQDDNWDNQNSRNPTYSRNSIMEEEGENNSDDSREGNSPYSYDGDSQTREVAVTRRSHRFNTLESPVSGKPLYKSMTSVTFKKAAEGIKDEIKNPEPQLEAKAQYFQLIRMWKVEVEKTKLLQKNIEDMKEQHAHEKKMLDEIKEENKALLVKIEELAVQLDKAITKCKHGGCHLCRKEEEEMKEDAEMGAMIDEAFDDANDDVDDDGEGSPSRKRRSNPRKDRKQAGTSSTQAQHIFLGRRSAMDRKNNPAPVIIAKLKQKKMSKFKNFMPLKMVLRQINQIYEERIKWSKESVVVKEEELNCFVYNLYLNNFGFKKIAEQKFIILVLSVKKYLHIVRINLFARFLGLLDGATNYTVDEFNKYVECMEFLNTNTLGTTIFNADTDSKHYTPYTRFLEYLKFFSENKLGIEEYIEFKKEFEPLKEPDPKNVNRYGIIDIDFFMMKILTKYRLVCNRTKQFVINAFKAADLDGDRMCNLREFILLYKYIESEKFDQEFVETLFDDYADLFVNNERNLSFDKFTVICVEYSLFSDYQQDKFLMITKKEQLLEQLDDLKNRWLTIYSNCENKLTGLKKAADKDVKKWMQILQVLGQRIQAPTPENIAEIKPLLIAMKIMEAEVDLLVENETEKKPDY